ncbi:MAG: aspartyl protease family protein [Syntrophothermus sp.]
MKKYFLFVLTLLALAGCSSNQKVILTKEEVKTSAVRARQYAGFEDELLSGSFMQAESLAINDDQKKTAQAYRAFAEGDEKTAKQIAAQVTASKDSAASEYSKQLLSYIYFAQSRWSELNRFTEKEQPEDAAQKVLSDAFSKLPKEEISLDEKSGRHEISFSSSGTPLIEVEVNGVKKRFWFDTGAGLSVIASDAAEECNVIPIGRDTAKSGTATSKEVGFMPAAIREMKFAGLTVKNHPVMIFNKKDLEFKLLGFITLMKIDGIIGWNLIRQLGWEVDYKNKTILPFTSDKTSSASRKNFIWFGYPAVSLSDSSGSELLFGLDTGAKATSLSQYYEVSAGSGTSETKTYGGAGGFEKMEVLNLKNISFNFTGSRVLFPEIYKKNHNFTSTVRLHGVIGSDLPRDNRLIIDYPHRSIILE